MLSRFSLGLVVAPRPPLLALLTAAAVLGFIANKQKDEFQFRLTWGHLVEMSHTYPIAGRIAIEYLKQSENSQHRNWLEKQSKKDKNV